MPLYSLLVSLLPFFYLVFCPCLVRAGQDKSAQRWGKIHRWESGVKVVQNNDTERSAVEASLFKEIRESPKCLIRNRTFWGLWRRRCVKGEKVRGRGPAPHLCPGWEFFF